MKKIINPIKNYFKGVKKEISRIRWTSSKDLFKYSLTTIGFMVALGAYFYIIDMLVSLLRSVV